MTKEILDYEYLSIIVDKFEISSQFSTSYKAHQKYALPETPVFSSYSQLELTGRLLDPVDRRDLVIEISISGHAPDPGHFESTLKDYEVKDDVGRVKYKKSKQGAFPSYNPPSIVGTVEKVRGEKRWKAFAWVPPALLTDMLIMLTNHSPMYVSICEIKKNRNRLISSISVNTNPEM